MTRRPGKSAPSPRQASAGYLENITIYADDRPQGQGPVGRSIRSGQPSIFNDFANDPRTAPWREGAITHGLRSAVALPIRFQDQIVGVFAVYVRDKDIFRKPEVDRLQEAADTISFALDLLHQEEQRQLAEEAVREREAQYRAVIETTPDGFYMLDCTGRFLEVNDAYLRRSRLQSG